jgi:hypothetical protein
MRLNGDLTGTGGLGLALSLAGRGGAKGLIVNPGDFRSGRGDVWGVVSLIGIWGDAGAEGAIAVVSLTLRVPSISAVPFESRLSLECVLAMGPRVGIWLLDGNMGVLFVDILSIDEVLFPIRGETGFEDNRWGILGGEVGERADTNEDVLSVAIEDVSLGTLIPLGRLGDGGSNGDSRGVVLDKEGIWGKAGDTCGEGCRISLLPCSNLSAKLLK